MSRDEGTAKILAQLDEHFVRLMRNWALVTVGNSAAVAFTGAYDGMAGDGYGTSGIPVLLGEARNVDEAMQLIDQRYRRAVFLFWTREGESLPRLAARIRPLMDYRTAQTWIVYGHEELRAQLRMLRARTHRLHMEASRLYSSA